MDNEEKFLNTAKERIERGELAIRVSLGDLVKKGDSKAVVLARIEAYAKSGAIIDHKDLKIAIEQAGFIREDFKALVPAFNQGIKQGVIQEPDNHQRYGERLASVLYIAQRGRA